MCKTPLEDAKKIKLEIPKFYACNFTLTTYIETTSIRKSDLIVQKSARQHETYEYLERKLFLKTSK